MRGAPQIGSRKGRGDSGMPFFSVIDVGRLESFGPWKAEGGTSFVVTQFQWDSATSVGGFDHIFTQEWRSAAS